MKKLSDLKKDVAATKTTTRPAKACRPAEGEKGGGRKGFRCPAPTKTQMDDGKMRGDKVVSNLK